MDTKGMPLGGQNITVQDRNLTKDLIISFKDPKQLWEDNWFALTLEVAAALILIQLFRNAKNRSPYTAYLILAAVCTDIGVEFLPIIPRPGYLLWWYHQGMVNFLQQRLPSYIVSIFALVLYMAHSVTQKSNLPSLSKSLLTAITGTLIMFPCLWLAPRFLLMLLHIDDEVFRDQLAGVPYIQVVVVLFAFFHTAHLYQQFFDEIDSQERNAFGYLKCAFQTGVVSAIYTYVEQYLLYILLTLLLRLHTGLCLVAALAILLYMAKDEIREMQMTSYSVQGIISPLLRKEFWMVAAAMIFMSTLPLWLDTQSLKSNGDRMELGECHITQDVSNTSPLLTKRRRFICPDDANTLHFDFHCASTEELMEGVMKNAKNYTLCGKAFENPNAVSNMWLLYSACCLTFFYVIMLFSFTFKVQPKKEIEKSGGSRIIPLGLSRFWK